MATQRQLAVLEEIGIELAQAQMNLEALDEELAGLAVPSQHHSLLRKIRNRQYGEVQRISERYRDLKNQFDMCFHVGCTTPITHSAYCDTHRPYPTRKATP